jgi:hypothetical protein
MRSEGPLKGTLKGVPSYIVAHRAALLQPTFRLGRRNCIDSRPSRVPSLYLLYWYKSTNTDAAAHIQTRGYPHFTCCTGTKVQILTQQRTYRPLLEMSQVLGPYFAAHFVITPAVFYALFGPSVAGTRFTCFTGTKVQILTRLRFSMPSVLQLLRWRT